MNKKKIKIVHVINDLNPGGAEKMLLNLVEHTDKKKFDIFVFSLRDRGVISAEIEKHGFPVFSFNIKHKYDFFIKFIKLIIMLIKTKPDIVHTWMYHSNLIGGIAAKLIYRTKIIWSIHSTTLEPGPEKVGTVLAIKLSTFLSKILPDKIILCSQASYNFHEDIGFDKDKMVIIPNGINLNLFKYSNEQKKNLIKQLKLDDDVKFIGMVGRYHTMKRHDIFLHAAQIIVQKYPYIHFILCGTEIDNSNNKLLALINLFGLGANVHLLGYISNMNNIYASLDILSVTSSYGESFPLTICEAMACEVPVIATDVGDTSYIINDKDMIIPTNEPMMLAKKWEKIILLDKKRRIEIGASNRSRIKKLFDIIIIEKSYRNSYQQIFNHT